MADLTCPSCREGVWWGVPHRCEWKRPVRPSEPQLALMHRNGWHPRTIAQRTGIPIDDVREALAREGIPYE